jgi:hypothetical protein
MNKTISDIDKFHRTKRGKFTFGIIELAVAYLAGSLAIDSGNLWQYAAAIIMLVGGANNLVRAISYARNGPNAKHETKKR